MKTPIDVDSVTRATGQAALGADPAEPVKGTQITRADSAKSTDDVVSFVSSSCLVFDRDDVPDCVSADDPDDRLISAGVEYFATDRVTAMAVNDPKYLPPEAEEVEGLQNKWPFDVEKKAYPYWDGTAGGAFDAEYEATEEIDGVEVYRFHQIDHRRADRGHRRRAGHLQHRQDHLGRAGHRLHREPELPPGARDRRGRQLHHPRPGVHAGAGPGRASTTPRRAATRSTWSATRSR